MGSSLVTRAPCFPRHGCAPLGRRMAVKVVVESRGLGHGMERPVDRLRSAEMASPTCGNPPGIGCMLRLIPTGGDREKRRTE